MPRKKKRNSRTVENISLIDNIKKSKAYIFLTENEIDQVISGKDLWMDAEEVAIRCMTLLENKNSQVDEEAE